METLLFTIMGLSIGMFLGFETPAAMPAVLKSHGWWSLGSMLGVTGFSYGLARDREKALG
jgi:hypothetical protein